MSLAETGQRGQDLPSLGPGHAASTPSWNSWASITCLLFQLLRELLRDGKHVTLPHVWVPGPFDDSMKSVNEARTHKLLSLSF